MPLPRTERSVRALGHHRCPRSQEKPMTAKIVSSAIIAGLLFGVSAPAFAQDAPKTKAECKKLTDMKWDSKTKTCVKK